MSKCYLAIVELLVVRSVLVS